MRHRELLFEKIKWKTLLGSRSEFHGSLDPGQYSERETYYDLTVLPMVNHHRSDSQLFTFEGTKRAILRTLFFGSKSHRISGAEQHFKKACLGELFYGINTIQLQFHLDAIHVYLYHLYLYL